MWATSLFVMDTRTRILFGWPYSVVKLGKKVILVVEKTRRVVPDNLLWLVK